MFTSCIHKELRGRVVMEALIQLICLIAGTGCLIWAAAIISVPLFIIAGILLAIGGVWIIVFGSIEEFLEGLHDLFD